MTVSTTDVLRARLLTLGGALADAKGWTLTTVGLYAIGDSKFFRRISRDGGFGTNTYDRVMQYCADNWPTGKQWPAGIPRPKRSKQQKEQTNGTPERQQEQA